MKCFNKRRAFKTSDDKVHFCKSVHSQPDFLIKCGQCIGCRINYAQEWASRMVNEQKYYKDSTFITLTYSPAYLPDNETLVKKELQLFLHRFCMRVKRQGHEKPRYYAVGEYGDKKGRPHYHAIIFGYEFPDKTLFEQSDGYSYYKSKMLEELWPQGMSIIGEANTLTMNYCAKYATKKITGQKAKEHYGKRIPEFTLVSTGRKENKGIGYRYFKDNWQDMYNRDFVYIHSKGKPYKAKPPRYYDKCLEKEHEDVYIKVKDKRIKIMEETYKDMDDHQILQKIEEDSQELWRESKAFSKRFDKYMKKFI